MLETLPQAIVTGVLLGGLYAIIGIGMSLIFGIMKLTNIAHGDIMILGTFLTMHITQSLTGNPIIGLLLTIAIMLAFAFAIQNFLINKVITKGAEPALLVTFGLSIIISNALFLVFGANTHTIPSTLVTTNLIRTAHVSVSMMYAVSFIVAVAVIVALSLVMNRTSFGRAIRAASSDTVMSELLGINTKHMYIFAMMLTVVTASIAGMLVGMTFPFYPTTGTQYLIIAFGVVVIGGMGSLLGTLVGGIILGLAQLVGANLIGATYQQLIGFIVLLVILAVRPQGLLSKAARK
ncbi:MAG: branched-chain amino acid ABC transporter permease [Clostridiales Family XIII bacterium]|jgi:branched-chain amino acid transport system permease protein|nr:branched-chain amino acid ABC transporter permease [Clostridiales Family XIII bacterium]